MFALQHASLTHIQFGNYAAANAEADELDVLADEKDASLWKAFGTLMRGCLLTLTGKGSDAVHIVTSGITAFRSTGAPAFMPLFLSYLAMAHAEIGQLDDAWRCTGEAATAVETTKERWWEAEVYRVAGDRA
jgi:predicted ATPase